MNLIILYSPTFVVSRLHCKTSVQELRSIISNRTNIPSDNLVLKYKGKVLVDNKLLEEYGVKSNSVIEMHEKLRGGTITGFPDVGHLIILFAVASLMLMFIILFLYTMVKEITRPLKNCDTFELLGLDLNEGSKLMIIFWIVLCFYAAMMVSIYTLYAYTYWCSDFAITSSPIITGSMIGLIFAVSIIIYYYVINTKIGFIERFLPNYRMQMKSKALLIFTIILSVISVGFLIHLAFTSINKWILVYPIGILISGILFYYFIIGRDYRMSMKIFIGIMILLISFGTYTTAFVMNSADMCV